MSDQHPVSRRDFVRAAAVGLGGLSAAGLPGAGVPEAAAAQAGRPAQAAGAHDKIVITLSPSGRSSLPGSPQTDTRDVNAHVAAALEGINAGAAVAHVRGGNLPGGGGPNLDSWRQLTEQIRARSSAIVNYGSSGMPAPVRKNLIGTLKPDAASVLVGHHFGGTPIPFEMQNQTVIDHLALGVLPEIELFHSGDVANLNRLVETGLLRPPYCVTIFLNYNAYYRVPPTVLQLGAMLELLPPGTHWTLNVKGPKHFDMAAVAISRGGHVRTGLENDVMVGERPAKSNGECVERIVQIARSLGREIASPADARQALGLPRKPETVTA
ncbi:MAG: hypothetical protein A3H29_11235 [Acidobacteria bacterium RIFCSPLOWO2_02_FULL_67_21]|nr:MAG: hypothetical protein A3H29_11235 [Acidobacteria bacterium RIFCSPLOWO2_02_FULL_67_21]